MPYIDWWNPFRLPKMSPYYHMFCTPGTAKSGVRRQVKYNFDLIEFKIRGYGYYIQRRCKGKWIH